MSLAHLIATELKTNDDDVIAAALDATTTAIASQITAPVQPDGAIVEMMVARRNGDRAWSFHLANLTRFNPFNPATINAAAAGGAIYIQGASMFLAFVAAVTMLASRPVNRAEAMTLHLAHRICRADGTFTLQTILDAADQLREEYGVVKNSPSDIEQYLAELQRAGCITESYDGYRCVEKIFITPL